ncbi:MAG: hypothetical protein A2V98_23295 [Planctomycetes bacterium RBG_16_64_12]|nr:MAG: hypothetical protein A2V98_23295 [Planctomycetes bacterium RBG_16_64_12]
MPADPEIARSFYQNWLLALGKEAGFRGAKVDVTGQARQRGGVYRVLRFTVQARATLEKLTEFLYKFYSVDRLHQIRTLSIKPTAGSSDLELTLVIEALSLPDGEPSEPPAAGRLAEYDQYTTAIANRNLFAPHKPAPPPAEKPPAEPGPPKFDPGKYAYLTAIVGVNGRPEVWVISRTSGEKLKLHEGDSFSVGELRGKVIQINRRDAEIEFDGDRGRWLVSMGDNLSDAVKLPDG